MQITIILESDDLTAESAPLLAQFLAAVPVKTPKATRKPRATPKPAQEQPLKDVPITVGDMPTEAPTNDALPPTNDAAAPDISLDMDPPVTGTPPPATSVTGTPPPSNGGDKHDAGMRALGFTPVAATAIAEETAPAQPASKISESKNLIDMQVATRTALREVAKERGRAEAFAIMHKYAKQADQLTAADCTAILAELGVA